MPTTTNFIWDDENYLAESDATNTITVVYTNEPQRYGNLVSSRISGTTSYHHFDALGSTRQLTSVVGSTTDTVIYDAWGNVVSRSGSTGVALLWVGQFGYYFDSEVGTSSVRERVYFAKGGRWTSVDDLVLLGARDRYRYASNAPVAAFDPSGRYPILPATPDESQNLIDILMGPPVEPPLINICPDLAPTGPLFPPAEELGYNPDWCKNSSFWDPSFCDQPLSPPCKCSQTRRNGTQDQVREQFKKLLFDQVTLCRVKVVFSPQCIPGADPNAALTCLSKTSEGGSIICLPIGLLGDWCKMRVLILHELLHAEQLCDGERIGADQELAAYRRQCIEIQQQRCPHKINEGDAERCALRLVGLSTNPDAIRLGEAACKQLLVNNDFPAQP